MNISGVSGAMFASSSPHLAGIRADARQLLVDMTAADMDPTVDSMVAAILNTLSNPDGNTAEALMALLQQVSQLFIHLDGSNPEFLEDFIEGYRETKGRGKEKLEELMRERLGLVVPSIGKEAISPVIEGPSGPMVSLGHIRRFLMIGRSSPMLDEVLTQLTGVEHSDGDDMKRELEELIRAILEGGVEDLEELSQLMTLLMMLGIKIDVRLLTEVENAIRDFVERKVNEAVDLVDVMVFLTIVREMISTALEDDLIDEDELMETFKIKNDLPHDAKSSSEGDVQSPENTDSLLGLFGNVEPVDGSNTLQGLKAMQYQLNIMNFNPLFGMDSSEMSAGLDLAAPMIAPLSDSEGSQDSSGEGENRDGEVYIGSSLTVQSGEELEEKRELMKGIFESLSSFMTEEESAFSLEMLDMVRELVEKHMKDIVDKMHDELF